MSRSRKKNCCVWISKRWSKFKQRASRKRATQACHEMEIDFDPDKDWEEFHKGEPQAEEGTRCGWDFPPNENDDTWQHESYEKGKRK